MSGAGPRTDRRRRFAAAAIALLTGLLVLPLHWELARAAENTELTLMFHGSVMGKIAPCG